MKLLLETGKDGKGWRSKLHSHPAIVRLTHLPCESDPSKSQTSAANFIANCPQLQELRLGFSSDDWSETAPVFTSIAKKTLLPKLKKFKLDFLRCRGEDLLLFLSNHKNLHSLSLADLDIIAGEESATYKHILHHLQHNHNNLANFSHRQIAQNSFRLFFEMHGVVECQSSPTAPLTQDEEGDFFSDFMNVVGPFKYIGEAAEWEGVQDKIGILKDDVRVSEKSYISDLAMYGIDSYQWFSSSEE